MSPPRIQFGQVKNYTPGGQGFLVEADGTKKVFHAWHSRRRLATPQRDGTLAFGGTSTRRFVQLPIANFDRIAFSSTGLDVVKFALMGDWVFRRDSLTDPNAQLVATCISFDVTQRHGFGFGYPRVVTQISSFGRLCTTMTDNAAVLVQVELKEGVRALNLNYRLENDKGEVLEGPMGQPLLPNDLQVGPEIFCRRAHVGYVSPGSWQLTFAPVETQE